MPSFADLISQSSAHAWLFIPSAILLGALHGLEPGHSKTMMAAFIIAIRGTVTQAVLLGLAATVSHTIVVWGIALGGLYIWQGVDAESFEPLFQMASGAIIVTIALWMLWRTRQDGRPAAHDHGHEHGESVHHVDTGHGVIAIEIFEDGVPPRWRVRCLSGERWAAGDVTLVTERSDGSRQAFAFRETGDALESIDDIPEPHAFTARISLGHGSHTHDYELAYAEGHDHAHGLDLSADAEDAHARAHSDDIRRRFSDRTVTTGQIVLFGLTGGLIPCPAAITVLLLCLQLKAITLGFTLVLCFSIGLAITLVTVGAAAALSVRHAAKRWSGFSAFARRAPYVSGALIMAVGLYVGISGYIALA
jgi:nickel/cobalt exporter